MLSEYILPWSSTIFWFSTPSYVVVSRFTTRIVFSSHRRLIQFAGHRNNWSYRRNDFIRKTSPAALVCWRLTNSKSQISKSSRDSYAIFKLLVINVDFQMWCGNINLRWRTGKYKPSQNSAYIQLHMFASVKICEFIAFRNRNWVILNFGDSQSNIIDQTYRCWSCFL